jgi:hypothetical protein
MITHDRLRSVVAGVSFGGFKPRIDITVTTKVKADGEFPAILIGIDTVDSAATDGKTIRLYECFAAPDYDDVKLAIWIKERCQDVLLHEMDEFYRFQGKMVTIPAHPVAEGVFDEVRRRRAP